MQIPLIPVSWGEVFDRISILEIKAQRLTAPSARAHVKDELGRLHRVAETLPHAVADCRSSLLAVNTRLWRLEDQIRAREAEQDFGATFIALARAIYHENDERGRIKRAINVRLHSPLMEEKQYVAYSAEP